jgi:hypothetical protein
MIRRRPRLRAPLCCRQGSSRFQCRPGYRHTPNFAAQCNCRAVRCCRLNAVWPVRQMGRHRRSRDGRLPWQRARNVNLFRPSRGERSRRLCLRYRQRGVASACGADDPPEREGFARPSRSTWTNTNGDGNPAASLLKETARVSGKTTDRGNLVAVPRNHCLGGKSTKIADPVKGLVPC